MDIVLLLYYTFVWVGDVIRTHTLQVCFFSKCLMGGFQMWDFGKKSIEGPFHGDVCDQNLRILHF